MTVLSRMFARQFKLPAAETHSIEVQRDLEIPVLDGTVLLAGQAR